MENAELVQKAYFGGQEQKPAEFNRVEYASKQLVTRIQNTQNFFLCVSNEIPHISPEDLWLAAIADMIENSPAPRADNDEFLEQLKIAEKQLGLSAQKVKRALCQSKLRFALVIASGVTIATASSGMIIYMLTAFGFKTALSLIFMSTLLILAGLGSFISYKAITCYKHTRAKIRNIDHQTKKFLQQKVRTPNQAEQFVLRRVQAIFPGLML